MKRTLILLLLTLISIPPLLAQYKYIKDCKPFEIEIEAANLKTNKIRFLYWTSCDEIINDTITIVNNKATIRGNINGASEGVIFTDMKNRFMDGPKVIRFIMEPGRMRVSFSIINDTVRNINIEGSKAQIEKINWEKRQSELYKKISDYKFVLEFDTALQKPDSTQIIRRRELLKSLNVYDQRRVDSSVSFIKDNPNSLLSVYLLRRYLRKIPIDSAANYFNNLSDHIRNSELGKGALDDLFALTDNIRFRQLHSDTAFFRKFEKVKNLYDISLPDETGRMVDLAKFKGKYVLLDFWGSWCGPCIKNAPYLDALIKKMKKEPIVFVSISLDKDSTVWKNAIKKHNYPGINLVDNASIAATFYKVPWVPKYIIINPDGSIANADTPTPRSGELERLIYSIMDKNKKSR